MLRILGVFKKYKTLVNNTVLFYFIFFLIATWSVSVIILFSIPNKHLFYRSTFNLIVILKNFKNLVTVQNDTVLPSS